MFVGNFLCVFFLWARPTLHQDFVVVSSVVFVPANLQTQTLMIYGVYLLTFLVLFLFIF